MPDDFDQYDEFYDGPDGAFEVDTPPEMPPGLVPPDLEDFDKEGTMADSMMDALNNSPDRVGFSTLMAALFKPQLDTEMEPFKGSNLTKPKQRKALGFALELFQWEYTSLGRNRIGAATMLSTQAQAVRANDKHAGSEAFDRADELAQTIVRINNQIAFLSDLPKSGHLPIGVPDLMTQMDMWRGYQQEIQDARMELAGLPQGPNSYYYFRKCWLEIHNSIVETTRGGRSLVDYTEVRAKWQSRKFQPGQLVSSMPWSYNVAYRMHIESMSEGSAWRDFIIKVFTQNPGAGNRGGGRGRRFNGMRRRPGQGNMEDF